MRLNPRAVGTALATAAVFAVAAGPASAASTGPSLAKAMHDVHAAKSALSQVSRYAHSKPSVARSALVRSSAELSAAAHQARWLHAHNVTAAATAFESVASTYDQQVQTVTPMVGSTTGSLQTLLAQFLMPAISGRTSALGFLGQLTSLLPTSGTSTATSTLTGLLGNTPTEISSLTGVAGLSGLPAQIEQIIAQAITASGTVLDAGITQLEALIPSLPTSVQPIVTMVLTTLSSTFGQLKTILTTATTSIGSLFGGMIGTQLGQVTSILQGLLGNLPGLSGITGGLGTGTGTGTGLLGTGTGTGTTTGGILGMLPFGLGNLLGGLLGNFGLSMPGII
jgi:hypothetical protein